MTFPVEYRRRCILFVLVTSITGGLCNLCLEITKENVQNSISRQSVPALGKKAGHYEKVDGVKEFVQCVVECCQLPSCNVALILGNSEDDERSCYLVSCNTSLPHGCDPKRTHGDQLKDSFMVSVRSIAETSSSEPPVDEVATTQSSTVQRSTAFHLSDSRRPDDMSCSVGTYDCMQYDHEECIVKDYSPQGLDDDEEEVLPRRRHGMCHCIQGFRRNSATKFCERIPLTTMTTKSKPGVTTDVSTEGLITTMVTSVNTNNTEQKVSVVDTTPKPTKSTTTTKRLIPLTVSAGGNKVLLLPRQSSVTLSALAVPKAETGKSYDYRWILILHPHADNIGEMKGTNTAELKLTNLIAGLYSFQVIVSSDDKYGEAFVNVTVKPPPRLNQPPLAVITPTRMEVKEGNTGVLDGSESKDDDKIVSYKWEMVSGPLTQRTITGDQAMLQLPNNLSPGVYVFKLTVTDSDSVSKSTTANVTVIKDVDYPPKANAGSDVILTLPENSVILNGDQSIDDKGIKSYEWVKKTDDKLTADMTGVRTSQLHLSNLQQGDYTFTLKVTDTAGQTNTADVHVFVKPESTKPPVANAGADISIALPVTTATLDGSASTEAKKITKYTWIQTKGKKATLDNADRAVATVSDLKLGTYEFQLTVFNGQNQQSSDTVTITVDEDKNQPPVAKAGDDMIVQLPVSVVTVDGSRSTDDKGIVRYEWTRDDRSPAAGEVLNSSDHQAVLQLTSLVAGQYIFTLKVVDDEGSSSTDNTHIKVEEDPNAENLVELYLDTNVDSFTEGNKKNLENQLALVLYRTSSDGDTKVRIQRIVTDLKTGKLGVIFYVEEVDKEENTRTVQPGLDVVNLLKKKMNSGSDLLEYKVSFVDTVVCLHNCSGHGHCDRYSKVCVCEAFWMENVFKAQFMSQESNCDWSILYVIIVLFIIVVATAILIWAIVCAVRRFKSRRKRRHRYALLEDEEEKEQQREKKEKLELLPRGKNGKRQITSLMMSESELSSGDEETLFINGKKNGVKPVNGLRPGSRSKVKT